MDATTQHFERFRRGGELEALGRAFDLVSPRLLALALHLTGNAADAEDVLQATFLVVMQKATTSYTVEVLARGRVLARGPLEVGPELVDAPRVDVPRVP